MTHDELVKIAGKWLKNNRNCKIVLEDVRGVTDEIPDAIGYKPYETILIECKASHSDFKRDRKKRFRQRTKLGMGNFRFYMCPSDLIKPEEIPKKWGLLYVTKSKRVKVIKDVMIPNIKSRNKNIFECNKVAEQTLLLHGFYLLKEGRLKKNQV
jgi:hypothetical protein